MILENDSAISMLILCSKKVLGLAVTAAWLEFIVVFLVNNSLSSCCFFLASRLTTVSLVTTRKLLDRILYSYNFTCVIILMKLLVGYFN